MEGVAALAGRCGAQVIPVEEIMFRTCLFATVSVAAAYVQPPGGQPNPNLKSTEVLPGHRVVFRIYAPKATAVTLTSDFATQGRGINWRLYLRDFTQLLFR